jgi:hypothetical protein
MKQTKAAKKAMQALADMNKEQQNRAHENRLKMIGYGRWLVERGEISQEEFERWPELQGDTPNGSQMATYTAANEQEFTELCEQYSQTLYDVKMAVQVRDLAYANAEEASAHLENERWKKGQTEERLRAYALLFGFALPDEIKAPEYIGEYVGEECIPF